MANLEAIKGREKQVHENRYSGQDPLPSVAVEEIHPLHLSPPWDGGCDRDADNGMIHHVITSPHIGIIRLIHATDQWMFKLFPALRKWGSFSNLVLTK